MVQLMYDIDEAAFIKSYSIDNGNLNFTWENVPAKKLLITDEKSEKDGMLFSFASRDGKEFSVCYGASKNGMQIDVRAMLNRDYGLIYIKNNKEASDEQR